jgi:alkylhydroperoxidase/carboxymuconolactone decarboxylase family protein YurZ
VRRFITYQLEEIAMLSLMPALSEQFTEFANEATTGGVLGERERVIATLAVALTLEDADAVKQIVMQAKQAGFSNEEIGQVSAIVVALRGQRIARLATAKAPVISLGTTQPNCC